MQIILKVLIIMFWEGVKKVVNFRIFVWPKLTTKVTGYGIKLMLTLEYLLKQVLVTLISKVSMIALVKDKMQQP